MDSKIQSSENADSIVAASRSTARYRRNWRIHQLFVKRDFEECLRVIEQQLYDTRGLCEYAIFVKGLIFRQQGKIQESLVMFQAAVCLNASSLPNLKQCARSLFLLGKHKPALEVYDEAEKLNDNDWEIWYQKGVCFLQLRHYDQSADCFLRANSMQRRECCYLQLGKVYQLQKRFDDAVQIYNELLEFSPSNSETLTTLGLVYLRMGDSQHAFEHLGNSLTHDSRNLKVNDSTQFTSIQTLLAAGSIIQDSQEYDAALAKYRIALTVCTSNSQVWSNIGMCFYGKGNYETAMHCLKHALLLSPSEWIVSFNLGLCCLMNGKFDNAAFHLTSVVNMKPDYGPAYANLALALGKGLGDVRNASVAFDKSLTLSEYNYVVMLYKAGDCEKAKSEFLKFKLCLAESMNSRRSADWDELRRKRDHLQGVLDV